jgi:hypothetical protein
MTMPFGEAGSSDDPSPELITTRLRHWLDTRLKHLARQQRIQDARSLRSEFSIEESSRRWHLLAQALPYCHDCYSRTEDWCVQYRQQLTFPVDADLKNEIVAGAFIIGCFFAIVVMNLIGYNADNCFIPQ